MMHTLIHWAIEYGLLIVFLNVLLMQLGLPLPTVPTLIVSGTLAADGHFSIVALLFVTILASLIGDMVWYGIGRHYGLRVMRLLCRLSLSPDSCVRQTELRFERWGLSTLVIAKFVPGLSLIVAPMSGALRLSLASFVMFDTVGIGLWASAAIGAGLLFHPNIELLSAQLMEMGNTAVLVAAALLAAYLLLKWLKRRRFNSAMRMARIDVSELQTLIMDGQPPVIVDVRGASVRSIAAQTIPGAVAVALEDWQQLIPHLDTDREIVVYCSCPNEASAAVLAKRLVDKGYHRARPLLGGIDAWIEAGHPTGLIGHESVISPDAGPQAVTVSQAIIVPAE
ncbi:DedA family protein/thiosulfate sulfurtransferase GlpE [Undibacterium sp.]|jgi:membrane protein DedA with SNARE-associated domain/rhodanese-related sulfurtransferase|uniref:DedA family protein/thiosulfate sulfurtransferase GlpE n=1 Tax=Undibacterium sp. TaxID=1914977 RepID=UPI002CAA348D|nr:DedA family protein/thiosulfate sulfurtransferase GlpE [Undibacterium sp.]HTD05044.1 DedA family protein/thiosulfate sulfurtransferase GlpE [Undibacterium sp.]